jgi:hypothetical protein
MNTREIGALIFALACIALALLATVLPVDQGAGPVVTPTTYGPPPAGWADR